MSAKENPTIVGFNCEAFVRLARRCFPAATKFYLSQITGIPARTVERHLEGQTKPGADHLLAYFAAGQFGLMLQDLQIRNSAKVPSPFPVQNSMDTLNYPKQPHGGVHAKQAGSAEEFQTFKT